MTLGMNIGMIKMIITRAEAVHAVESAMRSRSDPAWRRTKRDRDYRMRPPYIPVWVGLLAEMEHPALNAFEREVAVIERIDSGERMSKIVKHNGVVYLCGQVGSGPTVTEQTRDCLSRVEALLNKAGSSTDKMLQAVIWLADMGDFAEMNAVWDAWVPKGHAPARACGEAKLARPELKVEIIVTAAC